MIPQIRDGNYWFRELCVEQDLVHYHCTFSSACTLSCIFSQIRCPLIIDLSQNIGPSSVPKGHSVYFGIFGYVLGRHPFYLPLPAYGIF
jgi:hypothetical protein